MQVAKRNARSTKSVKRVDVTHCIVGHELRHDSLQYLRWKCLTFVDKRDEDISNENFYLLCKISSYETKEVAKDIDHELLRVWEITDEYNALHRRQGLK